MAVSVASGQAAKKEETCLEAWQKESAERGAYPVEDGTYKNVIVSIVSGSGTECYLGKVKVENNHVTTIYLSFEDNSYEYLDRTYKGESRAKINNGITDPLTTTAGEKIYVVFTDKFKPRKKQYKKAPKPGSPQG
jgi:hypothetical protein